MRAAYERFRQTAELATFLGTETLHLASYAPPVTYLGASPYQLGEAYAFADQSRVRLPESFSWQRVWDVLVELCCFCASVAAEHERAIIMEPRVGEVICSVDSLLRLIEAVDLPNFKANVDTGHFSAQRENVPLALAKLEGRFANVHISDNDPRSTEHLPIGKGTIDWEEVLRVLAAQGYDGYLGLDLGSQQTLAQDLVRSRDHLNDVATRLHVPLEW
ncbi:MAG: sugar phosphate isomerase/epimerase family protein [bacterium]